MKLTLCKSKSFDHLACSLEEYTTEIISSASRHAASIGPATTEIMQHLLSEHIQNAHHAAHMLLLLGDRYSDERLEVACMRVLYYKASSQIVYTVLSQRLDQLPLSDSIDLYGQRQLWD